MILKIGNYAASFLILLMLLSKKDLTSLLEFVITLVIIEINGANFAPIFF